MSDTVKTFMNNKDLWVTSCFSFGFKAHGNLRDPQLMLSEKETQQRNYTVETVIIDLNF